MAPDEGEDVVDVVGDAAGEGAEGFQFLAVEEFLLDLEPTGFHLETLQLRSGPGGEDRKDVARPSLRLDGLVVEDGQANLIL